MSDYKQWYVALRIARQSMPALANPRTAVVTLVATPLLEVVLLLVIALRLRVPETIIVTDASLVVTTITTMTGGITAAVVRDRAQGILAHIMATAPLHLRYWVSKFVPLAGIVTATNLIVATTVLVADPHHDLQLYALTLAGISTATVTSVGVTMVCAAGTIVLHDPFRLANIVTAVVPLSAGVLLPHTEYPAGIREMCAVLPGTWLVAALRENAPALMLVECGVSALWLVLGLTLFMVAGQLRYRSGRTELL